MGNCKSFDVSGIGSTLTFKKYFEWPSQGMYRENISNDLPKLCTKFPNISVVYSACEALKKCGLVPSFKSEAQV